MHYATLLGGRSAIIDLLRIGDDTRLNLRRVRALYCCNGAVFYNRMNDNMLDRVQARDSGFKWPEGKRMAISLTVLIETWTKAPPYSVQTTTLRQGTVDNSALTWGKYGGNEGAWRVLRILEHFDIPATFAINAKCVDVFPDIIEKVAATRHDVAAHGYYQDQLHIYMDPEEERKAIRDSLALIERSTGKRPQGWVCPVHAWSDNTIDLLVQEQIKWHGEVNYTSLPRIQTTPSGSIIALPFADFADNRVLRGNPKDFCDVFVETFDYLYAFEPMAMLPMTIHAHWGGRALMSAMVVKILEHFKRHDDIWFASSGAIADWVRDQGIADTPYKDRFF
jgi:allantoinase